MVAECMFSSKTVEWGTPRELIEWVEKQMGAPFDLDVCASPENAKAPRFFTKEQNGLAQKWEGLCWMNPPYGRDIGSWLAYAFAQTCGGATVVCLLPARTDTKWWHEWCQPLLKAGWDQVTGNIHFLKGRLRFEGAKASAPFPSVIIVYRPRE